MLLVHPPKTDKDIYLKILSKMMGLDIRLFESMEKYLGDQFFYILSMMAGHKIEFPSVEEINSLSLKINVYHEMKEKLPVKDAEFSELVNTIGDKYKLQPTQVFNFYKEINDKLEFK